MRLHQGRPGSLIATVHPLAYAVLPLTIALAGCHHGGAAPQPMGNGASARASDSIYREVAAAAGLHFRWGHGGRTPLDIRETIGHGCAFLDFDQDGRMDILLVGNRRCALYRNVGDGKFQDITTQSGITIDGDLCGVAVGDYDNDGFPDVYVTGYGSCALYHNRGHKPGPLFEDVTQRAGVGALGPYDFVSAAAWADLDGDGKLDLIAARYIEFTPSSPRFCKASNGVETSCDVKGYSPAPCHVYRNVGNGTFRDVTRAWGFDALHGRCLGLAVTADDSGRGVIVYAANDELPCDLMVKRGDRYVNVGAASGTAYSRDGMVQAGMGCDWGDYNNDGQPDLAVATFQSEPKSLYRADGGGRFTDVSGPTGIDFATVPYVAFTAKFLDYDNDGWLDLVLTNGHVQDNASKVDPARSYAQPLQLFHNAAGQRFTIAADGGAAFNTPIVGRGASVGDYDDDGRQDLLVVNEEGSVLLLHNERSTGNHWLGVHLVGAKCNRDAIGARVLLTAGGRTYVRDEQLAGGYFSSHDPRLHFGLGAAARVDRIEVRWPDGRRDVIAGADPRLKLDQYVTVTESAG